MNALAKMLGAVGFAVLLLAGSAAQTDAQDNDAASRIAKDDAAKDGTAKDGIVKDAPAKDAKPAAVLTKENIKEKLENLGYEPKHIGKTPADALYRLNFVRDNYRFVLDVGISPDGQLVWFVAPLKKLPEPKDVRPDILEKILLLNDDIGPTHLSMRSNRMLYLNLAVDNRDMTPARLRGLIDAFAKDIRGSESLWNPSRYPAPTTVAEAKKTDAK